MTNREKYIDKASNEKLARFIANERCEEFYKCDKQCVPPKEDDIKGIANWLSQEAELTADEMFEELGYKKSSDLHYFGYVYDKKDGDYVDRIVIEKTKFEFFYIKHRISYTKYFYDEYIRSRTITEEEDKAIHKKIEELKKGVIYDI